MTHRDITIRGLGRALADGHFPVQHSLGLVCEGVHVPKVHLACDIAACHEAALQVQGHADEPHLCLLQTVFLHQRSKFTGGCVLCRVCGSFMTGQEIRPGAVRWSEVANQHRECSCPLLASSASLYSGRKPCWFWACWLCRATQPLADEAYASVHHDMHLGTVM